MEVVWFCKLYKYINRIEAQRQLSWLQVYAFPHVKPEVGQRTIRDLQKLAQGEAVTRSNQASDPEVTIGWNKLRGMGIKQG